LLFEVTWFLCPRAIIEQRALLALPILSLSRK
jgi:hypothetical protein